MTPFKGVEISGGARLERGRVVFDGIRAGVRLTFALALVAGLAGCAAPRSSMPPAGAVECVKAMREACNGSAVCLREALPVCTH